MRKKIAILAAAFVSLFLTACFDALEVGDYAYVTMMGIERGVTDNLRITFQIPEFQLGGEGGNSGGGEEENKKEDKENITIDAPSLLSAVSIINGSVSKILNFMHLKAIVISENLAVEGRLSEYVASLLRYRQIRRSTIVIVSKGSAREFIAATKPYLTGLVTDTLEELIDRSEHTGLFPKVKLGDLNNSIKSPNGQLLGLYGSINRGENYIEDGMEYTGEYKVPGDYYAGDVPKKGGPQIELLGSTVSDGNKLVGKLTGFETQMLLLMRGELKRAAFTIEDPESPEYMIPIEVKEFEKPKSKIDLSGSAPKIECQLHLEGDITVIQSGINYEDHDMKEVVEKAFEEYLENGIERTFAKCKVFKADVFNFGEKAIKQFWTIQDWENYKWMDKFADAELKIDVDFTIRRTGKFLKSAPITSSEGEK